MANQPDVKVDFANKRVYLLDGMVYSLSTWRAAPKIGAEHGGNNLSRRENDRFVGGEPGRENADNGCLTCHEPHAGKMEHLLRKDARNQGDEKFLSRSREIDFMSLSGGGRHVPESQRSYLRGQS
jgi:hypothetical protein